MAMKGAQASAHVRQNNASKRREDLLPIIEELREKGAKSLRELAHGLNLAGLTTARGGNWSATQIQRVLLA
jgi:hypothetical protein